MAISTLLRAFAKEPALDYEKQVVETPLLAFRSMSLDGYLDSSPVSAGVSFCVRSLGFDTFYTHILSKQEKENVNTSIRTASGVGGCFFQHGDETLVSYLDTKSIPYIETPGSGRHSAFSLKKEIPLFVEDKPLVLSLDYEVPHFVSESGGVGQLAFFTYVKHVPTGNVFCQIFLIFDNRGRRYPGNIMHDGITPFTHSALGPRCRYGDSSSSSVSMQYRPFLRMNTVEVASTRSKFIQQIRDLNRYVVDNPTKAYCSSTFSENVEDYVYTEVGVLHEVVQVRGPQSHIEMGVRYRDFKLLR